MRTADKEGDIEQAFNAFWDKEKKKVFDYIIQEENLNEIKVAEVMSSYLFTGRLPKELELVDSLEEKPSFRERKAVGEKLMQRVNDFIVQYLK